MTTYKDIAEALKETLKEVVPGCTVYSVARVEAIERPAFFFTIKPIITEPANMRTRHNVLAVYIDYLQKVKDEADMYDVAGKLREALGFAYRVGKRYLYVTDFDFDFVGKERNVLEMSVTFEYFDMIEAEEKAEPMGEAIVSIRLREVYK